MSQIDDRRFAKLIERANRLFGGNDACHGCQRPLRSGEWTVVAKDRDGRGYRVLAECCK